jgi:DNA-binding response OmpR family regulator
MGSEQPTVLVVEDEPPLVEIYARWLESEYRVRTAQNGSEALEQVDEDVDVALLDRLMPGMSGDEVLAEILDRAPDCRVAMVTAVEPDFDIITMGFDDYLTKPVEKETLLETVDRLLERSDYQRLEQEFYALVSKRSALQAAKSAEELSTSEDFAELEHRIEELETELDTAMCDVDDGSSSRWSGISRPRARTRPSHRTARRTRSPRTCRTGQTPTTHPEGGRDELPDDRAR